MAGALVFPFLGTVGPLFLSAIGISMTKGLFVISGCVTAFLENFLVLTGIRFAWHCKKEGSAAEERFDKSVSLEEKTKEIMRLYENPAEREALAKEIRFLMASDETKETGQQILNLFKYEPQEHNDLTNIMYAQAWLERYSAGQDLTGEELSKIKAVRSQISPELPVAQYLDQVIATLEKPQQDLGIAAETLCKNLAEKEGEDLEELLIFMYNPLEEESGNWDASSYTSEEIKRVEEALGLKKEALEGLPDAESEGSVTQRCIDLIFKILTEFAEARGG